MGSKYHRAEHMPIRHKAYLYTRRHLSRTIIGDRIALSGSPRSILPCIKGLSLWLAFRSLAVEIFSVFFLNLAGIRQHDRGQIAGRWRAVNWAGESLTHQIRQVAAVIDVGVAQHHRANVAGSKWEGAIAVSRFRSLALI